MSDLKRLCDFITERKKALPPYSYEQRAAHHRAVTVIFDELQANEGAVWRSDWRGASIKLAGIRSTSTSSPLSALSNWQAAAEKRIAQGPRLTPTQRKILENAAGKTPPHRPQGRAQHGGWSGAMVTCYQRKWLREGNIITDEGRKALEGGAA
ncbi:hypothetical protein DXT96_07520 [Agrobacterium sp. ICMP 6402]|uniref:hypothetical protein n=1 Tax=Agrobacterium sp. ICMP 6402 TaxID=2292443 RepID=UPI001295863B|nr:hypothetical protein [Agrobacterium sp. ICMP 6402]MQB09703.1 hypothetical protein [Agrobacterium sp. ICMP 6402]